MNTHPLTRGRVLDLSTDRLSLTLGSAQGTLEVQCEIDPEIQRGDWVELSSDGKTYRAKLLTPNRSTERTLRFMNRVLDPRRTRAIQTRKRCEEVLHRYFESQDFLHTRTPLLVPCPGMEPHIRVFKTESGSYLPTSPEFAMKRLLAGGLERIYQLNSCFRLEEKSSTHLAEFTMVEWYRAFEKLEAIQSDVENLIEKLAVEVRGEPTLKYSNQTISVKAPWPRLSTRGLFQEYLGLDLAFATLEDLKRACKKSQLSFLDGASWDDLYFVLWLNLIEPKLPADRAVFVQDYPVSQAALAKVAAHPDGTQWARRFEFYIGGLELGNAFEELTDPAEQRRRFEADMRLREKVYGASFEKTPIDEDFLDALKEGLPPCSGIAVGFDRLVMLMADEPNIDFTVWLTPYSGVDRACYKGPSV